MAEHRSCPNCGHTLAHYRSESQHVGHRTVWLRWLICGGCRHMVLQDWAYGDEQPGDELPLPDEAPIRSS